MKRIHLLVNPVSGLKNGEKILESVMPYFEKERIELNILKTEYSRHAEQYANTLEFKNYDGMCAIGGDGTMFELINGMLKREDKEKIPIGLIAGGTGNSFMHDINCLDPKSSVKKIIKGDIRSIDIAKVNADGKIYYSFNIIGWGLAVDAGILAERLRWLGGFRYNFASIIEVIRGKKRLAELTLDNEKINSDFVFIIACNTMHTGKGMKMAPYSIMDDGKIDLVIVKKAPKLKLLSLFPKLFSGDHVKSSLVEYRQVEKFSIYPKDESLLNIDGEPIGNTPCKVEILNKGIDVLV